MSDSGLLACYEEILGLSRAMLAAAQRDEWDELVAIEAKRDVLLDKLTKGVFPDVDSEMARQRQVALIREILATDEASRPLIEAWRMELKEILASIGTERKVQEAYVSPD